jgi:hypothetical protein
MTDAPDRERRVHLGRRVESLPTWAFALFLVTAAVVVLSTVFGFRGHTASDGTDCGAVLSPTGVESIGWDRAGCSDLIGADVPLVLGLAALCVALVVASTVTLIVRGWTRREPAPWPGSTGP